MASRITYGVLVKVGEVIVRDKWTDKELVDIVVCHDGKYAVASVPATIVDIHDKIRPVIGDTILVNWDYTNCFLEIRDAVATDCRVELNWDLPVVDKRPYTKDEFLEEFNVR